MRKGSVMAGCGELAGIRTQDPRLKRALLYQLSYELVQVAFQLGSPGLGCTLEPSAL